MPAPLVYANLDSKSVFVRVPKERQTSDLNVLYFTNRARTADPEKERSAFGVERSQSLSFGSAIVGVKNGISWDDLATESVATQRKNPLDLYLKQIWELGRFPDMPYSIERMEHGRFRRSLQVVRIHEKARSDLQIEIARELSIATRKEVVLFIHGYNNTFSFATLTASELCHFLGREFVCAVFSWPAGGSRGLFFGYNVDRESAEFSTLHLKQVIRMIAGTPGLERLNIVAHSRGTDLLASAMEQLRIESYVSGDNFSKGLKLRNIVLIAPDIDSNIASIKMFSTLSDPDLPIGKESNPSFVFGSSDLKVSIYTSPNDRALSLSEWLFGSLRRLGRLMLTDVGIEAHDYLKSLEGHVDIIQVPNRTDFFGHSYFTSNPAVSADLISLLRYNENPDGGQRQLEHVDGPFWRLRERHERE